MIVEWLSVRVEAEAARRQKMKDVHPQVTALVRVTAGQQGRKLDPMGGYLGDKLLKGARISGGVAMAA